LRTFIEDFAPPTNNSFRPKLLRGWFNSNVRPAKEAAMKAEITKAPVAETEMVIRRPVADVFEAFIDPDVTTNRP
jgi:hypothetical protein